MAIHPTRAHLFHIECSLDALSWAAREKRFAAKFEHGRRFVSGVFEGLKLPDTPEQVALLQFAGESRATLAGARIVTGAALVQEIMLALADTSPSSSAVPPTLPLLRTLQLAGAAQRKAAVGAGLLST